jgi:Ribulose 1,5-bisphosphate carboxylase, large subunit
MGGILMDKYSFAFPEMCYEKDYIIATYFVETAAPDIVKYAAALADEQTTGTWVTVPGESNTIREKFGGKVVGIYETPDYETVVPEDVKDRRYIISIAYPAINIGTSIPMLLSTVIGNIAAGGKLKLMDLTFPRSYIRKFKGPKFGIQGVRDILKVYDRPLVNNMIKPCTGWTPEEGAKMLYEAAVGGVDIVKDDELMAANETFCPLEERVKACMAAVKRAYEETGEYTLYTVNITDDVSKLRDNALRAINAGANALMVNIYTVGYSAVKMLCDDPEINVPVLAHPDFAGAIYESCNSGITAPVLMGKLARLSGADMAIITSPYGKFPVVREKYIRIAHMLRQELYDIKPVLPMPGGGMYQGIVPKTISDLGVDQAIASGGAIHGHPMGATAGARSIRQAIDASMKGIPLREYAKDHKELAAAIDKWGCEDKSLFDLKV